MSVVTPHIAQLMYNNLNTMVCIGVRRGGYLSGMIRDCVMNDGVLIEVVSEMVAVKYSDITSVAFEVESSHQVLISLIQQQVK